MFLLHGTEQLIESGDLELLVEAPGGLRLRTQSTFRLEPTPAFYRPTGVPPLIMTRASQLVINLNKAAQEH